eukprot:8397666-Pyramimonas_sp.AAC.1
MPEPLHVGKHRGQRRQHPPELLPAAGPQRLRLVVGRADVDAHRAEEAKAPRRSSSSAATRPASLSRWRP